MGEITNLFKDQAARIFSCYKESDKLQDFLQKSQDDLELAKSETKEVEDIEEIQKSETELAFDVLDEPFEFNL